MYLSWTLTQFYLFYGLSAKFYVRKRDVLEEGYFLPFPHCMSDFCVTSWRQICSRNEEECWHNCLHLLVFGSQMETFLSWASQHMFLSFSSLTWCGKAKDWKWSSHVSMYARYFRNFRIGMTFDESALLLFFEWLLLCLLFLPLHFAKGSIFAHLINSKWDGRSERSTFTR